MLANRYHQPNKRTYKQNVKNKAKATYNKWVTKKNRSKTKFRQKHHFFKRKQYRPFIKQKKQTVKYKRKPFTFKFKWLKKHKYLSYLLKYYKYRRKNNKAALALAKDYTPVVYNNKKPKWRLQWSNFFSKLMYIDKKYPKKDSVTDLRDWPWVTGSRNWPFWVTHPRWLPRPKYKRLVWMGLTRKHKLYKLYKFYKKQRDFVPPRYWYLISATWTPAYITLFYIISLFKKNPARKLKLAPSWSLNEFSATKKLSKDVKRFIKKNPFFFYKNPYYWKSVQWHPRRRFLKLKKMTLIKRGVVYRTQDFKRLLNVYYKFSRKLRNNNSTIKDLFYTNKWVPLLFLLLNKIRALHCKLRREFLYKRHKLDRKKKSLRNYAYKYIKVGNTNFKQTLLKIKSGVLNQNKIRQSHRFGTYYWWKKLALYSWSKNGQWFGIGEKKMRQVRRVFIPHKFRHTQKKPYSYYNQSRWQNKAYQWLNTILYGRQLFPYKLVYCVTKQKRHPKLRKRWAVYRWLHYTLNNRWNYSMRAEKNYRLKQILFGRIVLPSFNYLLKNQFLFIKKNTSHVKPLGLSNSRPALFLGKFERRIDILTYKLNFAPTIQWARWFVESGLIYVSYWTQVTTNYRQTLSKYQQFPLLWFWKTQLNEISSERAYNVSFKPKYSSVSHTYFKMPLPITLPAYRLGLKGLVFWSNQNLKTWFYSKHFKRIMPKYFIFNKTKTIAYFWRNLSLNDIDRLKRTRVKKNTFNWLS